MTHPRPFRFGVNMGEPLSGATWADKARKVESLGYSVFAVPDHFGRQLAYAPTLAAAALATTTLRIGTFVLDNDFRHPAIVAADAATLDQLSGGRFELGLGAGWMRKDYESSGISFDAPGVRFRRLTESICIIKGLFADGPVTFAGDYYTVANLEGTPKPVQTPHPPLLIGGGGPRMLRFAAQEANIVSVLLRSRREGGLDESDVTAVRVGEKIGWIRDAAGDRFAALELNMLVQGLAVTDDRQAGAATVAARLGSTPEAVLDTPYVLIGTAVEIADTLREQRERFDISYVTVSERDMDAFAPVVARLAGT